MLNKLFTSKTRVEVMQLLLFNLDKEYYLREIANLINCHPSIVTTELENLSNMGLLNKKKRGNLMFYSVNKDCAFLNDLKNIFIKTDFFGDVIRKELNGKAKYCLIYGSFAKGTENSRSDVDLMVISGITEDELLEIIKKIENITKREINFVLWDEKTFKVKAKSNHLLRAIIQNNIIMLIGDENEFRNQIK